MKINFPKPVETRHIVAFLLHPKLEFGNSSFPVNIPLLSLYYLGPQSLGYFNHTFNMGMVEGGNNFAIGENEGGTCPTQSNFVDDRKCPNKSNPKLKSSTYLKDNLE